MKLLCAFTSLCAIFHKFPSLTCFLFSMFLSCYSCDFVAPKVLVNMKLLCASMPWLNYIFVIFLKFSILTLELVGQ